eukprot:5597875-Pleurochrysis_carterae.AAC.2
MKIIIYISSFDINLAVTRARDRIEGDAADADASARLVRRQRPHPRHQRATRLRACTGPARTAREAQLCRARNTRT